MSKHLGNILEPIPLMDRHGADALRWFMLCGGSPWSARRIGHRALEEIVRKVLLTYWNTASFQTPVRAEQRLGARRAGPASRPLLDRWALSRGAPAGRRGGRGARRASTPLRAGSAWPGCIDDLSNWYVRRSRRRFWDGDPAALATLHECLDVLTRLLAPFMPFVTERVWSALVARHRAADSVHLASWPGPDAGAGRPGAGRAGGAGPPAGRAGPGGPGGVEGEDPAAAGPGAGLARPAGRRCRRSCATQVAGRAQRRQALTPAERADELVDVTVKPNFRALGKRFGKRTQAVAARSRAADAAALAAALRGPAPRR